MTREHARRAPLPVVVTIKIKKGFQVATLAFLPIHACAAPLDAFLAADNRMMAREGWLELAYDAVNNALDVFGIRANDPVYGGTNVGDYSGAHMRGSYALTDRLSIDGGLWQRTISYREDKQSLSSWQVAAQYRFLERGYRRDTSYALRMGVWGNSADSLSKSTPTTVQGTMLNTVNVIKPQDLQVQADVLGTWRFGDWVDWSAFVGAGASRITVDSVSATYINKAGCSFNLTITATASIATLAAPCGDILSASASAPTDLLQETSYNSRYYQAGTMMQWRNNNWQLTGGFHFQRSNRNHVDDLIASRGGIAYKTNRIVALEILRKSGQNLAVFARGQVMSHQFAGEIPFTYNSITAHKFDRRYGFASFGLLLAM